MSARPRNAFTLIELLIVVAIIAILALIAVPNFLEAQTRAKVSRAKNDLRSLAVATQIYRLDNNAWPFNPQYPRPHHQDIVQAHNWPWQYGHWFSLTTPIAYVNAVPHDTFWRTYNPHWDIWRDYYRVWNIGGPDRPTNEWGGLSTHNLARNGVQILMASVGPDKVEDVSDGDAAGQGIGTGGITIYDATNGTVSWGDIYYGLPGVAFDGMQEKACQ